MRSFLFELFHASNKNANIGKITQGKHRFYLLASSRLSDSISPVFRSSLYFCEIFNQIDRTFSPKFLSIQFLTLFEIIDPSLLCTCYPQSSQIQKSIIEYFLALGSRRIDKSGDSKQASGVNFARLFSFHTKLDGCF